MLRITRALDHFERCRIYRDRMNHSARFYLDDRGHAWLALRQRTRTRTAVQAEPGEFYSYESAAAMLAHLRHWYREPGQNEATNRKAHLARWRIVRAATDQDERGEPAGRFDLVELARLPAAGPEAWPPAELRPVSLDGWEFEDLSARLRECEVEDRASRERWEQAQRHRMHYGDHDWTDRERLTKLVRPSKTTRTVSAHYAERAGKWHRVDDPEAVWRKRDTVEVMVRLRDPRLAVAIYKRKGSVRTRESRRLCRVWYGYDHHLETIDGQTHERRVVDAPAGQAAAIRQLLDRAQRDLAGILAAERGRGRRKPQCEAKAARQTSLF